MTQEARGAAPSRKKSPTPPPKPGTRAGAENHSAFLNHYQAALLQLQQGKYEKALIAFETLVPTAPAEMKERCNMYAQTCQRQLEKHNLSFSTPEEQYDYAISLLNIGYFEEAREQFNALLASYPDADYAYYGLALLDSIGGRTGDCLRNLALAIELNPKNRLQARVDSDFQSMVDDPRFTELLYPEVP